MRTTVRMDSHLKEELEEIARAEGTTFTALIHEAAVEFVARRRAAPAAQQDFELPVFGDPNGPKIDLEQLAREVEADEQAYIRRQFGELP